MDARPAGLRQWPDRKAISQGAPQGARKQGGLQFTPHKRKNVTERENGEGRLDGSQLGGAEATRRPDRRSQTREREPRPTPGENTQGKVGKKSIRTQPWRELEDSTLIRTPKVSSRDGATGSDSNTDRSRGERKAHSQTETVPKRLNSTGNGVKETHPPRGEENDHQAQTHQTTLPQGRETNGKPEPGPTAIPRHLPQT